MPQTPIRILIAEDHALVRKGLKSLISSQPEFDVVAEAENGLEAIQMTRDFEPDLILLDLSMPRMNGLATMRQLKKDHAQVKILVITMHASQDYLIPTLKEGADGYLLKGDDPQELFSAIRAIMDGKAYLSTELSGQLINSVINPGTGNAGDPLSQLTQREKEVFQLVAEGNTNQQIADLLFISPKTVDKHRTNLMKKLDLHSAREVTNFALKNGLIITSLTNRPMLTDLTHASPDEFNRLMAHLPMACRVFEQAADGSLVFVEANPAADRIFRINHARLKGRPIDIAFPHFDGSVIPERYLEVLKTGRSWSYHGVFYQENGSFLGLFNVNAFRLSATQIVTFAFPQEERDAELIFHKKKMNMKDATISYPQAVKGQHQNLDLQAIQKLTASKIPRLQPDAEEELNAQDIKFTDLFTINELENIQEAFTNVTNVASIITMPDGRPITRSSNFCTLCDKIIRKTPRGLANCIQSDALIGKPNPNGPTLRPCLSAGLWDCGASIIIGEKHVANWLAGQVRLSHQTNTEKLIRYAREIGADPDEFLEAYHQVPVVPYPHFYRICHSLFLFANLISDMAYQNLRLVRSHTIQEQISKALQASEARLQNLSSKLILTQEEERKQLAVELHDGIGQSLTAVKYSVDNVLLNLDNPRVDTREAIRSASDIIKDSIADVRRMQVELRPRILDELGIIATINWFCREFRSIYSNLTLEINVDVKENRISNRLKPAVFRIIQEAFNNAAKYCEGDTISLSFIEKGEFLVLEIRDNGIGFDLEEVLSSRELNRGLGLDSMRERAELCGGQLDILSGPGRGTTVRGTWKAVADPS